MQETQTKYMNTFLALMYDGETTDASAGWLGECVGSHSDVTGLGMRADR